MPVRTSPAIAHVPGAGAQIQRRATASAVGDESHASMSRAHTNEPPATFTEARQEPGPARQVRYPSAAWPRGPAKDHAVTVSMVDQRVPHAFGFSERSCPFATPDTARTIKTATPVPSF